MKLKAVYKSLDEIPEQYRDLYSEVKPGSFELSEVEGIKTVEDVKRVTDALNKNREEIKELKVKYVTPWGDRDPAVELPRLDKLPELEETVKTLKEGSKFDETKVEGIVQARISAVRGPLDSQLKKAQQELEASNARINNYERADKTRRIHDVVREVAAKANLDKSTFATPESALMLLAERHLEVTAEGTVVTRDGSGVIPGLLPDVWINEITEKHSYLRAPSAGGGAAGSGATGHSGPNPFDKGSNFNLTAQGRLTRENPKLAEQLAKIAKK